MRFTDLVLSLHPAIVTVAFVTLFVVAGIAANIYPLGSAEASASFSVSMLAMLGLIILWHYSLYRSASDRNVQAVGHRGRRGIFFLLGIAGFLSNLALFEQMSGSRHADALVTPFVISGLVGNLSLFAAIWASANALTRFDDRTKSAEFHKTLGTFVLEFYLPFGIWVLYPRIKRLLAEPRAET